MEEDPRDKNGAPIEKKGAKKGLSDSQRDRLENMLRNLYPDRNPLAETMVSIENLGPQTTFHMITVFFKGLVYGARGRMGGDCGVRR